MTLRLCAILLAASAMSACSTVELPNLGMNLPEFRESIDDLDSAYPQAEEIPSMPDDVRNAAQWDQSAREMQALREGFDRPEVEPALPDAEFDRQFDAAQDYANAFRNDDPS